MKKITERDYSDFLIFRGLHEGPPFKRRLDQNNEDQENSSGLDNLLDSDMPFDSACLLDSEDPTDLEDLFELRTSGPIGTMSSLSSILDVEQTH